MSDDLVEEPFKSAAKRVSDAYDKATEELKSKVEKAKAEALKKISQ
ncbi:MAG: hypothetical protein JRM80_11095 [Nitrososphaerota archaeon]|nr:hypothetical protein [Nitrososphaerota archaeon]MDG6989953.1 hypothetical protein [Nitrososphaerota archaeon]